MRRSLVQVVASEGLREIVVEAGSWVSPETTVCVYRFYFLTINILVILMSVLSCSFYRLWNIEILNIYSLHPPHPHPPHFVACLVQALHMVVSQILRAVYM